MISFSKLLPTIDLHMGRKNFTRGLCGVAMISALVWTIKETCFFFFGTRHPAGLPVGTALVEWAQVTGYVLFLVVLLGAAAILSEAKSKALSKFLTYVLFFFTFCIQLIVVCWFLYDFSNVLTWIPKPSSSLSLFLSAAFVLPLTTLILYASEKLKNRVSKRLIFSTVLISFLVAASAYLDFGSYPPRRTASATTPNILIISADGVESRRMSVYGHAKPNTPFLDSLESRALMAENTFSPASATYGVTAAILTARSPITTKVFWPPNRLSQEDGEKNLATLLESLGYRFFSYGDTFNDPDHQGIRTARPTPNGVFSSFRNQGTKVLFRQLLDRIVILGGPMRWLDWIDFSHNRMPWVVAPRSDTVLMDRMFHDLQESSAPFLANIHLSDSHCCGFTFVKTNVRRSNTDELNDAIYDDAIAQVDRHIKRMFDWLDGRQILDNTIVVVTSDHAGGKKRATDVRVPLLFFFPNGKHAGTRVANTSLLDIAPTLLDAMEETIPEWMEGNSLLHGEPPSDRMLFAARRIHSGPGFTRVARPPTYGNKEVALVQCDQVYLYDLESRRVTSHQTVTDRTGSACAKRAPASEDSVKLTIEAHLSSNNFNNIK